MKINNLLKELFTPMVLYQQELKVKNINCNANIKTKFNESVLLWQARSKTVFQLPQALYTNHLLINNSKICPILKYA